jgi:pentapeptide repeat protein
MATAVGVAASATVLVFVVAPDLFAPEQGPGFGPVAEENARHDVRTSALQLIAGLVLAAGGIFTARTVRLNQESNAIERDALITDRYASAVGLLGHDQASVRLGGVYSLDRIARESERDRATIIDVLNAHARAYGGGKALEERVKPDVEGAVIVIAKRIRREDDDFYPVFNDIGLSHARLRGLHLDESRFRGAILREALLDGADLTNARLKGADLSGAHLYGTKLKGAEFERTILTGAKYDELTEWPKGFNPKAAGALRSERARPTPRLGR